MGYRFDVKILKIDEDTNEVVDTVEESYKSVAMLADGLEEGHVCELIMQTNLFDLACKVAQAKHFKKAAVLSQTLNKIHDMMNGDAEDNLLEKLIGGLQ